MEIQAAIPQSPAVRTGIAERLWEAARVEFSLRGYHGARVQGIARRAACNVALLYRHWSSKKALYLEILRDIWTTSSCEIVAVIEQGGAPAVVSAYVDAMMRDPLGAQILIREFLDGSPFMSQLAAAEPDLVEPSRRAARALASGDADARAALRPGIDPMLAVLSIGGLAALVASAHEATRLFFEQPVPVETWRAHLRDLLLRGVLSCPETPKPPAANVGNGAPAI